MVASCFRLPAGHVPGRDRLRQARHLAAAAVAAVAVVAEPACPAFFLFARALHPLQRSAAKAVGRMRPVLFLFHRALHRFRHFEEALPVDEIQTAGLRRVAHVQLRPSGPVCRTADAQVLGRDSAPESLLFHLGQNSGPLLIVVLVVEHVRQMIGLTRAPESHQAVGDRLCLLAPQAYPQDRVPRLPPGLCPDPVAGCLPHAQQRESAAECSLDFRL